MQAYAADVYTFAYVSAWLIYRKQCSGSKWKEMTGSGIFAGDNGEESTGQRAYQVSIISIFPLIHKIKQLISAESSSSMWGREERCPVYHF